jgi:hypothetical protein
MKNAFAMGGTHVQVQALHEPRQMGECFVNVYRISGTAYREAKSASASGDVVQSLRELQRRARPAPSRSPSSRSSRPI